MAGPDLLATGAGPTEGDIRAVVQLAGLAPSVHNTQPWRFRWDGTALELREDVARSLPVLDPDGRERVLSCGAALLNARIGLAGLGWAADVELLPDGEDAPLLARLTPTGTAEVQADGHELAAAATRRATDRDPYDPRPVPDAVLDALRRAAEAESGFLHLVTPDESVEVDVLVARADRAQRSDPDYLAELQRWRTASARTGVPDDALPTVPAAARGSNPPLRDFDARRLQGQEGRGADPPLPEHPAVLVLGTDGHARRDWLRAGQVLQRVLLQATVAGVAAQPVTSVLEVPVLRGRLRAALCLIGHPQMVLRIGYGSQGPVTGRLPVDQVLEIVGSGAA